MFESIQFGPWELGECGIPEHPTDHLIDVVAPIPPGNVLMARNVKKGLVIIIHENGEHWVIKKPEE